MPSTVYNDIRVELNHLADLPLWEKEKPYELNVDLPPGVPYTNCEYTRHEVDIRDLRTSDTELGFDTTGFKYIKHSSQCLPPFDGLGDESDDSAVVPYLAETIKLVQEQLEAEKVVAIDWRYRKNMRDKSLANKNLARHVAQKPFQTVHSDYSLDSGKPRLRSFLTREELAKYDSKQWRIRIFNIWRPLIPVVDDAPMAFCDRRSVKRSDLVAYDKILADRDAENSFLKHRSYHRWCWLSKQKIDEPAMFVVWDSLDLEKGPGDLPGLVPHSSFNNPNASADAPLRQSIEVQVIAVTRRE